MKPPKSLYLICIELPKNLADQVVDIKTDFREQFESKRALRSPSHITLQIPFHVLDENQEVLVNSLLEFGKTQHPFNIQLKDFNVFEPKVLFIDVVENPSLSALHDELMLVMRKKVGLPEKQTPLKYNPHVTIAHRDLSEENFYKAWEFYKTQEFEGDFSVNSIFLWKHNSVNWETYKEIPLG